MFDARMLRRLIGFMLAVLAVYAAAYLQQQSRSSTVSPIQPTVMVTPTAEAAMTFVAPTPRPTEDTPDDLAPYPVYGPGVELRNDVWLNSDSPLRLADLRGRVVLLSFWAFECVPCLPVLANLRGWHDNYAEQGLMVIGIHYPKIEAERSYNGLVAALARLDVPYPVAQDNDGITWRAYGQQVWPTLTLLDKRGSIRYQQVGAGGYEAMETAILALLEESG